MTLLFTFGFGAMNAQNSFEEVLNSSNKFDEIVENGERYFKKKHPNLKLNQLTEGEHRDGKFVKFMRWQSFWKHSLNPDGTLGDLSAHWIEANKKGNSAEKSASPYSDVKWTNLSYENYITDQIGLGRTTSIGFHPTNPAIFYVGAAIGGIWKTTDGGQTYEPLGDELPFLAVSSIIVDKNNPNTIYIATGDHEKYTVPSIGVYKSTDGGRNWSATALQFEFTEGVRIHWMEAAPNNPNKIFVAATNGLYRTDDGFATYTKVNDFSSFHVKFKYGDPNTIYQGGEYGKLYKSTDGGINFSNTATFDEGSVYIMLTPQNTSKIYVINGSKLYKSTDSGLNFSNSNDLSDDKGLFAISPTNENIIIGGYIGSDFVTERSDDDGQTFRATSNWRGREGLPQIHVDQRNIFMNPLESDFLYYCNDGGVYKYSISTNTFQNLSDGLMITQFYDIAVAQTDKNVIGGGSQDNGNVFRSSEGVWDDYEPTGDGMNQEIDPTDANVRYWSYQNGGLRRWINGVNTVIEPTSNDGAWEMPYKLDPNNSDRIVAGYSEVYSSIDRGDNWTSISAGTDFGGKLEELAIAPSNSNRIYVSRGNQLFVKNIANNTWTRKQLPTNRGISDLEVDPRDMNIIYITNPGFTDGDKVFKSTDAGDTWENISGSLPNISTGAIETYNDIAGALFVGTDAGVYYRDEQMEDWQEFGELPHTRVEDIEIQYAEKLIRVGTYGRGVLEAPLNILSSETQNAKALSFTENSEIISVPDAPSLDLSSEISIEFWCNPTSTDGYTIYAMKATNGSWSNGYGVVADVDGTLSFMLDGWRTPSYLRTDYILPSNEWTHVAATYDGSTSSIYINGALYQSINTEVSIPHNDLSLSIGGDGSFPAYGLNGQLDELRIWNRALSQGEIQTNKDCQLQGNEAGLAAYYDFNQGIARGNNTNITTLIDRTENGNDGTLNNFALTGDRSNWAAESPVAETCESCTDTDGDGICNADDNCPNTPNPDQADSDGDNIGDVCDADTGIRGDEPCFRIRHAVFGSSRSLTSVNRSSIRGVHMASSSDTQEQYWKIEEIGQAQNGRIQYKFTSAAGDQDQCLDSNRPDRSGFGGAAHLANCGNFSGQIWTAEPIRLPGINIDFARLRTSFGGENLCLTTDNNGEQVFLVNCEDRTDQLWYFESVEDCGNSFCTDTDGDGVCDTDDNCLTTANASQADFDNDSLGDVCDPDDDNDGIPDVADAFPFDPSESSDTDADGIGDNKDNCLTTVNPNQLDSNGNGIGDACENNEPTLGTCDNPITIGCGSIVSGNTADGENNFGSTTTSVGTGPELVYELNITQKTNVSIRLTNLQGDLDLFLGRNCVVGDFQQLEGGSSSTPGNVDENISIELEAGKYYLTVEGYDGAQSSFNLDVACDTETGTVYRCGLAETTPIWSFGHGFIDGEFIPNNPVIETDGLLQTFGTDDPGEGIYQVTADERYFNDRYTLSRGDIFMVPGLTENNTRSVIRFTAPIDAVYEVNCDWTAIEENASTIYSYVATNAAGSQGFRFGDIQEGFTLFHGGFHVGTSSSTRFKREIPLRAGEEVHFGLGASFDGNETDAQLVDISVKLLGAIPESLIENVEQREENILPEEISVNLFPNPVVEMINIEVTEVERIDKVRITDTRGRLVWESDNILNQNYIKVDTNNFSNGMYYVQIQSDAGTFTKSFVVSK